MFVGIGQLFDLFSFTDSLGGNPFIVTGNGFSVACGRVAFVLGLTGPCFAVDTACSSSMVALSQAHAAIRLGQCDAAITAGVNVFHDPRIVVLLCQAKMLSRDGRCRTFDDAAGGYGRGEGYTAFALRAPKRLTARRPVLSLWFAARRSTRMGGARASGAERRAAAGPHPIRPRRRRC